MFPPKTSRWPKSLRKQPNNSLHDQHSSASGEAALPPLTLSSPSLQEQHLAWRTDPESAVKRHHRRPGTDAETRQIRIRPEIRADLACLSRSSPYRFKPTGFRDILHPRITFKLFPDSPRRLGRQGMSAHHMLIGQQTQQTHFRNPAEQKRLLAQAFKPTLGNRMVGVPVHRKSYPNVDVRQVDHQNQSPSGPTSFLSASESTASSTAYSRSPASC